MNVLIHTEYTFTAIAPRSTLAPDSVLSMGQIEVNCVIMLNWIVWNKTVFDIETVYLCLNEFFEIELFWHLTFCKQKLYLY